VAALKRNAALVGPSSPRSAYWREFQEGDPRQALVKELGSMLAPHWIRPEVWRHLAWLLEWEVNRTAATSGVPTADDESEPLSLREWEEARDRLAQLWDWWAEGTHMRSQPYREEGDTGFIFKPPYTDRLAKKIAPTELPRGTVPDPCALRRWTRT
jgi:hypothetical protein